MAPLRIHKHAPHHRLTPQQHPVAHCIAVGEGEFDRPTLLAEHQLLPNHVEVLRDAAGVAHAALLQHRRLMAHHHTAVALEWMHLKTDPQLTIPLEGDDVEGMQRRRRRARIDACLNRRQSKPWQRAPLLTADDDFVGQGRCGSLSREHKILDRLKTPRANSWCFLGTAGTDQTMQKAVLTTQAVNHKDLILITTSPI